MQKKFCDIRGFLFLFVTASMVIGAPVFYSNQVAYDTRGAKVAVLQADAQLSGTTLFNVINSSTSAVVYTDTLRGPLTVSDWNTGKTYYKANFSAFKGTGTFKVSATVSGTQCSSEAFVVDDNALAKQTMPWILKYINNQRANTATEWSIDSTDRLYNSSQTVNLRGGWGDDAGNSSKYVSHLNYANFFSPQQIPMHAWELCDATERVPDLLNTLGIRDTMRAEAVWGADYLYRILSPQGFFYMVVFDSLSCTTSKRRICGLLANSAEDNRWQCSFRAGGGMCIAALARISQLKKNGIFTYQNYLDGAKRGYAHLVANNTTYLYDGKENIIDDYCALMAATELWIATDSTGYRDDARKRAQNLNARMSSAGYFIADNGTRPFWSACDAGLPIWALVRYLDKETDATNRAAALATIKKNLDYQLSITNKVQNPFGYARQSFAYNNAIKEGFFIPQTNETGWWWQGENARLGSLATAAILGGRLVYPSDNTSTNGWGIKDSLAEYASQQINWVLGCNPYSMCFMYGFGKNYPPVTSACFGHTSTKGGISNGITGKAGNGDGSGIEYITNGDTWRSMEQWIPHAIRMLAAVASMVQPVSSVSNISESKSHQTISGLKIFIAKKMLSFSFSNRLSESTPISLYTVNGKNLAHWVVPQGKNSAAFSLPKLSRGVYCVSVGNGNSYRVNLQ